MCWCKAGSHAEPSIKNFIKTNADVAKHLIGGKIGIIYRTLEMSISMKETEQGLVHTEMRKDAYILSTPVVLTWDCPRRGSGVSVNGDVREGPAENPLKRIGLE